MGGHGHAHEPPYKIPDYKNFTSKGIPQLEELENALKKKGLRDPWIRNEAWRFHPGFGTKWTRAYHAMLRGMPLGLTLALVTVGVGKMLGGDDKHGHGAH